MNILGVSAFYHDSAAALLVDGRVAAAAQEERFSRRRHDASFPHRAIASCLAAAGLAARDIDHVAFYDKPLLKFERLLETYLAYAPRGFASFRQALPAWVKDKLFQRNRLLESLRGMAPEVDWPARLLFSEHHLSHAASAYFPSPFERAAVLTLDGVGEWATTTLALGRGRELAVTREIHFPHSLGLLYSAFTYHAGFRVNSGEYKLMGLAPYGEPRFAGLIREHLIDVKEDGSYRLNMDYFGYCTGLTMTNGNFARLFGGAAREPESPLGRREMDLAASVQLVLEEVVVKLARGIARDTGEKNLCLAGGVALNCVANARVQAAGAFERLWVQPAAGDAGGALGAALCIQHLHLRAPRSTAPQGDGMAGAFLGPEYSDEEIGQRLRAAGAVFEMLDEDSLLAACVEALAAQQALGWFQGRMEFGPRALGARSILADARAPEMQRTLNLKVKYRESFRPFAPAVLGEDAAEWFALDGESPYMLLVAKVRGGQVALPAVTHVDQSARVQTVRRDTQPRFHRLLQAFKRRTGCPVLVNTSFNVRGEPIVATPEDAFRCFMGTEIERLAIGRCWLVKEAQHSRRRTRHAAAFAPD